MNTVENDIEHIYSDTEITINKLKVELAKKGIASLVKNEFQSGVIAGFGAPVGSVDLYVNVNQAKEAMSIIEDLNS